MSIKNELDQKVEELEKIKAEEFQACQETLRLKKIQPLLDAVDELKNQYVTEPSYQWQASDRVVRLWVSRLFMAAY